MGAPAASRRVRPYGERALLVEVDDLAAVLSLAAALRRDPPPGVLDVVPAARTVLVTVVADASVDLVRRHLDRLPPAAPPAPDTAPVEIAVVYDGADLGEVAAAIGLSPAGVVDAHTARAWTVAFCGFAPGFAYLTGGDPRLDVARRIVPRTRVPAGSVALAGPFCAVYPSASPGGWQLLGRTNEQMWDLDRDRPARLEAGMTVRFRAVDDLPAIPTEPAAVDIGRAAVDVGRAAVDTGRARSSARPAIADPRLEVVAPGVHTTIQDAGRPGHAALGVSPSGAADRAAWARGNRLVGNRVGAAGLEATLGGLIVRSPVRRLVAVTGAVVPLDLDGRPVAMDATITLPAGSTLGLGRPDVGLRTYLAVRGGVDVPAVLGSRSRDDLGRLGPAPVRAGDRLPVGAAAARMPDLDLAPQPATGGEVVLRCHPGPRTDWVTRTARQLLVGAGWEVTADLDRVGVRLTGPRLARRSRGELPSEGLVRGAVQVPPSGQPLVFLADHPTTGGYPVIAVVIDADTDRLAQVRPGQPVRFRWAGAGPG